ncbi:MAG: hypothetical protein LBB88_11300 [Planctomycetaceae bacterium]|jgi:hypothetical protein|nr:hypothetical protein [Planctomycetaceae bacterium]
MRINYQIFLCFLFSVFCLTGCGVNSNLPVSGKVTFENGSPLTSGEIIFALENSDDYFAKGKINNDGTYTLVEQVVGKRGIACKSGCQKGKFKVFIASTSTTQILPNGATQTTHIIDQNYADKTKTPLKITVPENNYDFKISAYKK